MKTVRAWETESHFTVTVGISATLTTPPPLCEFQFTALNIMDFQFTPKLSPLRGEKKLQIIIFKTLYGAARRPAFFTPFATLSQRFPLFLQWFKHLKWLSTPSKSVYILIISNLLSNLIGEISVYLSQVKISVYRWLKKRFQFTLAQVKISVYLCHKIEFQFTTETLRDSV